MPLKLTVSLLLSLLLAAGAAADAREGGESFHEGLLEMMRAELDFEERYQAMSSLVEEHFDLVTVARISLGAGWRELDEQQREQLTGEMLSLIAATYADRFTRYNQHRFVTRDVREAGAGRHLVRTRLERVDDDDVRMDYYLLEGRVFNVVADGVSDLSVRRAEYSAIYRSQGFDGLVRDIRQKTAEYRAANAS